MEDAETARVRDAEVADLDALAALWFESWQYAHLAISPQELIRHRTLESFRERLAEGREMVRTIGPVGDPDGFTYVRGTELNQIFVHDRARGSGVARALLADAERILAVNGADPAWLDCAIGNDRAARFYEKHGWRNKGVQTIELTLPSGPFPLDIWRYEKELT